MISAIKDGRPGDSFVAAVELCGAELARHFPPGALNRDELLNKTGKRPNKKRRRPVSAS
jgi:uncharacterized membrane protein